MVIGIVAIAMPQKPRIRFTPMRRAFLLRLAGAMLFDAAAFLAVHRAAVGVVPANGEDSI
ncbi:hypothetical protein GCM10007874_37210 [Labrys miyagiensis]|uniref:Uncharacterized protein n=1 Tax=Labrys miyagiensis TaxID=346912 RepID=A0ABQ6CLS1_9HYPH|nr:hypothetical protein GCM10007874_37210 [Labrys miyagiensis]